MQPSVFEHLLSCRSCNSAVLIEDPSASFSAVKRADLVGMVFRHGAREVFGGVSWLDVFPLSANHPLSNSPDIDAEQQSISRQFICMEDCATPEGRRQTSKQWGLQWWGFEQHFETISAWTGTNVGECPCECHKWHVEDASCEDAGCVDGEAASEGDECDSVDSTVPLVSGQEAERCPVKPGGWEAGPRDDGLPAGWPEEGRDRAWSEDIRHTDLWILEWREQCRRELDRRESA